MKTERFKRRSVRRTGRKGVAAVEFAIVLPLFALFLLGSIDVGQAIYVSQVVNEASREAARQGARFDTQSESEVAESVRDYIRNNSVGMSSADVAVSFTDSSGAAIPDGDLTSVSSGSTITVQVDFQFDSVRWLPGLPILDSKTISTTTIMRRE